MEVMKRTPFFKGNRSVSNSLKPITKWSLTDLTDLCNPFIFLYAYFV